MPHNLLKVPYSTWEQLVTLNNFIVYYHSHTDDTGVVWCGNVDFIYESYIDVDSFASYDEDFSANAVSVESRDDAIAHIIGIQKLPITRINGKSIVSVFPTEGSRKTIISHNWTDPTTWYSTAIQEVQLELDVDPLSLNTVYTSDIPYWIDTKHGKLWDEDNLSEYYVLVEVSTNGGSTWSTKTEEDPHVKEHSGQNGHYTIDYEEGVIIFHSSQGLGAKVRATFFKADLSSSGCSAFIIAPEEGKQLKLKSAEIQFSKDIELKDTVVFESYGFVDIFAPQLMPGIPSGTKIPLGAAKYKGIRDFYNESNGAFPVYPAIGTNWRGISKEILVMRWDYAAMLTLYHSYGMEIRVYLEHDKKFSGTYATATVYALSENE